MQIQRCKSGKVGHIAPVCRSKPGKGLPNHAQWLVSLEQDCPGDCPLEKSLSVVNDESSSLLTV